MREGKGREGDGRICRLEVHMYNLIRLEDGACVFIPLEEGGLTLLRCEAIRYLHPWSGDQKVQSSTKGQGNM